MKIAALLVFLLSPNCGTFGQTTALSAGKPHTTTFLHQTLGESSEEFMHISGTKMCESKKPQAAGWCETFKKIGAGEEGVVTDGNATTSVSLVFANQKLVQVIVHGNADWNKSISEFSQKYGAPDTQIANSAVWSFADGGGITIDGQSNSSFTATFYSKDRPPKNQTSNAPLPVNGIATTEGSPVPASTPTTFKNLVLGATFNDIVAAGVLRAEMCDGKVKGDLKKACKEVEQIRTGQFTSFVIQDDQTGRVVLNFEASKLIAIRIEPSRSTNFELQLIELSKRYGKPTTLDSIAMQNGFGATWNQGYAIWKMPDGAEINEMEFLVNGDRRVHVDFKCKELSEKEQSAYASKQMTY